jgi:hypothetical protein
MRDIIAAGHKCVSMRASEGSYFRVSNITVVTMSKSAVLRENRGLTDLAFLDSLARGWEISLNGYVSNMTKPGLPITQKRGLTQSLSSTCCFC